MITDVEIVVSIGVVLIVVYFLGSYYKHRKLTKYAHMFEDKMKERARVQFRSFGHAGLSIRLEMKDKSDGFKEVYFALSMGARENILHYPLVSLTKGYDRITCWGILEKPVKSNIRILSIKQKKELRDSEERPNMRRISFDPLEKIGYVVYTTNTEFARNLLSRFSIAEKLEKIKGIEIIETDMTSSLVKVVSRLKEEAVFDVIGFLFSIGRAI